LWAPLLLLSTIQCFTKLLHVCFLVLYLFLWLNLFCTTSSILTKADSH
jgi:hypothetical protein